MTSNEQERFNPDFGSPLLLRPEGYDGELRTYFIGMEQPQYVICSLGNALADNTALAALRDRTRRTRLFYVREGVMRGFTVRIIGFKTSPFRHLYLSFPEISHSFNLRDHDRIDCHLPALIASPRNSRQGMISNISQGGCRLSLRTQGPAMDWLRENEEYELSMQMPTLPAPLQCRAKLAQRSPDDDLLHLGLGFVSFAEEHEQEIITFIEYVSNYRI